MHRAQRDSLPFWKTRIHTATHVGTNFFSTLVRLLIRRALWNHFVFVLNNAPFVVRAPRFPTEIPCLSANSAFISFLR